MGHGEINNGYVWFQLVGLLYCLPAVRGFADDFPAAWCTKEASYAAADEFVVVRHQDAQLLGSSTHFTGTVTRTILPLQLEPISTRPPITSTPSSILPIPT